MRSLVALTVCMVLCTSCFFNIDRDGKKVTSDSSLAGIIVIEDVRGALTESYLKAGFADLSKGGSIRAKSTPQFVYSVRSEKCEAGKLEPTEETKREIKFLDVGSLLYGQLEGDVEEILPSEDNTYLQVFGEPYLEGEKQVRTKGTEALAFGLRVSVPSKLEELSVDGEAVDGSKTIELSKAKAPTLSWEENRDPAESDYIRIEMTAQSGTDTYALFCTVAEKELLNGSSRSRWQVPSTAYSVLPASDVVAIRVRRLQQYRYKPNNYRYILLDAYRSWVLRATLS